MIKNKKNTNKRMMKKERILCIASTPYHLFNLYNILLSEEYQNKEVDICITDEAIKNQVDALAESKLIHNIYYAECFYKFSIGREKEFPIVRWIHMFIDILLCQKWINKHMNKKEQWYDWMFISYPAIQIQILQAFYFSINPNIRVVMYEDGLGTYQDFGFFTHKRMTILYTLLFHRNIYNHIEYLYVYCPALIDIKKRTISIKKIIDKADTGYFIKYYYNHFQNEIKKYKNIRFIFFDQCLVNESSERQNKEIGVARFIQRIVGSDKMLFKVHPRMASHINLEGLNVGYGRLPFEILLHMIDNIEDLVLISINSTSCVTPMMIMNKEVPVISIVKIIDSVQDLPVLYSNVQKLYKEPKKIYLPSNLKELEEILYTYIK